MKSDSEGRLNEELNYYSESRTKSDDGVEVVDVCQDEAGILHYCSIVNVGVDDV